MGNVLFSISRFFCVKLAAGCHCMLPGGQETYLVLESLSGDLGWKIKLTVAKLCKVYCCPPGHLPVCLELTKQCEAFALAVTLSSSWETVQKHVWF